MVIIPNDNALIFLLRNHFLVSDISDGKDMWCTCRIGVLTLVEINLVVGVNWKNFIWIDGHEH